MSKRNERDLFRDLLSPIITFGSHASSTSSCCSRTELFSFGNMPTSSEGDDDTFDYELHLLAMQFQKCEYRRLAVSELWLLW